MGRGQKSRYIDPAITNFAVISLAFKCAETDEDTGFDELVGATGVPASIVAGFEVIEVARNAIHAPDFDVQAEFCDAEEKAGNHG